MNLFLMHTSNTMNSLNSDPISEDVVTDSRAAENPDKITQKLNDFADISPSIEPTHIRTGVETKEQRQVMELDSLGTGEKDTVCICKRTSKPVIPVRCSKDNLLYEGDDETRQQLEAKGFQIAPANKLQSIKCPPSSSIGNRARERSMAAIEDRLTNEAVAETSG
jgi:hypothetical protein